VEFGEDLDPLVSKAYSAGSAALADSTAEVVEPLGSEILLNVRAGPHAMVARVDPSTRLKIHEIVRLAFDPGRLHFFDTASGAAI
jgi:multiple sugar transport system ATP-binding protein